MNAGREQLFRRFDELGIEALTVPYPRQGAARRYARDVHEESAAEGKKGATCLVVAHEDQTVDLKTLHARIGAVRSLRFASADQMRDVLRASPGALTPLALLDDEEGLVTVLVDANLMGAVQLNFHPLANTESTRIRPDDLPRFITSCGRAAVITDLGHVAGVGAAQ